jgi:hypothetical protein
VADSSAGTRVPEAHRRRGAVRRGRGRPWGSAGMLGKLGSNQLRPVTIDASSRTERRRHLPPEGRTDRAFTERASAAGDRMGGRQIRALAHNGVPS